MFLLVACASPPAPSEALGSLADSGCVGCPDTESDTDTDTDADTDTDVASDDTAETTDTDDSDTTDALYDSDKDSDGYTWEEEIDAGSDPNDPTSRPYTGGWPYRVDKDDLGSPDPATTPLEVGEQIPRFVLEDQFKEQVDLYDFALDGRPIVIDRSGVWCSWCREMAALLDGQAYTLWDPEYERLAELVDDGDIYWITIIDTGLTNTEPANAEAIAEWYDAYPHPLIPVLLDDAWEWHDWTDAECYPDFVLVEEDMTIGALDDCRGDWRSLAAVLDRFPE